MQTLLKLLGFFITILFLIKCSDQKNKHTVNQNQISDDSLAIKIKEARSSRTDKALRYELLEQSLAEIEDIDSDSTKSSYYSKIPYAFYKLNDSIQFMNHVMKALELSKKAKDSMAIADLYWDLGNYYDDLNVSDSSYYYYNEAYQVFESQDSISKSAKMLLNMAIIQKNIKDYTSSEGTTIKALERFKLIDDNRRVYSCYNNLGLILAELDDYERSFFYYNRALEYLEKLDQKNISSKAISYNNIGNLLRKQGKYEEAIDNYENGIELDSLFIKDPRSYALLLDNLGYAKLQLGDTSKLPDLFIKS
ncbi:MAG: tetratricopeptide repeat protein, partial [Flavobacteriaceae bacterium]|nr:tetratricopeptide repeat protein [Flavobacteriaceae bacterium]